MHFTAIPSLQAKVQNQSACPYLGAVWVLANLQKFSDIRLHANEGQYPVSSQQGPCCMHSMHSPAHEAI